MTSLASVSSGLYIRSVSCWKLPVQRAGAYIAGGAARAALQARPGESEQPRTHSHAEKARELLSPGNNDLLMAPVIGSGPTKNYIRSGYPYSHVTTYQSNKYQDCSIDDLISALNLNVAETSNNYYHNKSQVYRSSKHEHDRSKGNGEKYGGGQRLGYRLTEYELQCLEVRKMVEQLTGTTRNVKNTILQLRNCSLQERNYIRNVYERVSGGIHGFDNKEGSDEDWCEIEEARQFLSRLLGYEQEESDDDDYYDDEEDSDEDFDEDSEFDDYDDESDYDY